MGGSARFEPVEPDLEFNDTILCSIRVRISCQVVEVVQVFADSGRIPRRNGLIR